MSYIESTISQGEQVFHRGQVSLMSAIPAFIGGGLLILAGLPGLSTSGSLPVLSWIGLAWIVFAILRRFTTELAVTNKRVIAKTGIISRHTVELNLKKVESVQVRQGIFGRMMNYGSVVVAGAGNPQAPIPFISSPLEFRNAVTAAQEKFAA
jgi:uncharacterized membrane protein YdbT with pleckstrin-like domain